MKTTQQPIFGRALLAAAIATAALVSLPLQAIEYESGDTKVKFDATFSAGASWRVSERAAYNIRSAGETPSIGNSGSGNDSNLNFNKGDIFSKVVKVTPELEITHGDYGAFFRAKAFYDFKIMDGDLRYYKAGINRQGLNDVGRSADLLDAFAYGNFDIGSHPLTVRLGQQALGWGEAVFSSGGIANVNPRDGNAASLPGSEVKEVILPTIMAYFNFGFSDSISTEGFFRPKDAWKQTVLPSCGSYFLPRDITGRMSTNPNDANSCTHLRIAGPAVTVDANGNPIGSDLFVTGPAGAGFMPRDPDVKPEKDEYGLALRFLLPNDYDLALFYTMANATTGTIYGRPATTAAPSSATYGFYFPEGIETYGLSFNGTSWGNSWQGELVYRPNSPLNFSEAAMVGGNLAYRFGVVPVPLITGLLPGGLKTLNFTEEAETWQGSVATIKVLSPTALWDSGSLLVEAVANYAALNGDAIVIRPATLRHPDVNEFAWGYRARFGVSYFNVSPLGLTLSPSVVWLHDVNGVARSGVGQSLKEGNQTMVLGLETKYLTKHTVSVSYTNFLTSKAYADNMSDRDFVSLNYIYSL